jgi:nitrate/nitrite transporter NarK
MLAGGVVGYVLLATGVAALMVVATSLVFGLGWGVNGLFFLAVVKEYPRAPGGATGLIIACGSVGGVAGPPLFGLIVQNMGFGGAWSVAAAWAAVGCLAVSAGRAALRRLAEPDDGNARHQAV